MNKILCFIGILLLFSCVERLNPEIVKHEEYLVVDALLTDEAKEHRIRLTYAREVDAFGSYNIPEEDAIVTVIDDLGNEFLFRYQGYGFYTSSPDEFIAEVGREYQLRIETASGKIYESNIQKMIGLPEDFSVYKEPYSKDKLVSHIPEDIVVREKNAIYKKYFDSVLYRFPTEEKGFDIYIDSHDPENKCEYYRYLVTETWEEYNPWPDPPENQRHCWISSDLKKVVLNSTAHYSGNDIKKFKVISVDNTTNKLIIRYSVSVKMLSVSKEEYEYWRKIKLLNEGQGDLYDPMPSSIVGNVTCCDNPDEKVLGYFSVSGLNKKRFFIDSTEHNLDIYNNYLDCIYVPDPKNGLHGVTFWTICSELNFITVEDRCWDCRLRGSSGRPNYWNDYVSNE